MSLYRWSEMIIVIIGVGSLFTAIVCLGSLAALKLRRAWYRWRGRREFSHTDRVSLEALARLERKP